MTQLSVEERLMRALGEVASRIADDDRPLVMRDITPTRSSHWLGRAVVAAAVLAVVVGVGIAARWDGSDGVPITVGAPHPLLTIEVGGETIGLRPTTSGDRCVELDVVPGVTPVDPPACLLGRPLAVQETVRAGRTLVYGIAASPDRFLVTPSSAEFREVTFGDGAAFVLVINSVNASGVVTLMDDTGRRVAEAAFDHGGPPRLPKGTIGKSRILLAFHQDGAVWAVTSDGNRVRLSDGTLKNPDDFPIVAADGHTVLYGKASPEEGSVFDVPLALDARDGTTSTISNFGETFSSDGRLVAGVIGHDDASAEEEVVVLDGATFSEAGRVTFARSSDEVGGVLHLAWDVGDRELLAVAKRTDLWTLDTFGGTATRLAVDAAEAGEWVIAEQAVAPGVFPAVRRRGSLSDWGYLRVEGGHATFERVRSLPTRTTQATLDAGRVLFLDRLDGPLAVGGDDRLTASSDDEPTYLIGDGRNLFQLTAAGVLTFLLPAIDFASAP